MRIKSFRRERYPFSARRFLRLSGKRKNKWEKLPYYNGGVKTEYAVFPLSSRLA